MSRIRILYIAGIGRNGGTLLDRVLGETDGLASLGEVHFLWQKGLRDDELCGCGARFSECKFWRPVIQAAWADGADQAPDPARMIALAERVDKTRRIPRLLMPWRGRRFDAALAEYGGAWARVLRALHEACGGAVLVDSSKFASRALILASLPEVDLYVLHLVRDSRGTAWSWQKKVRKPEVTDGHALIRRYSPASTAVQWLYRNLSAHLLRRRAHGFMRLRYEDFAEHPRERTAQLLRWIGAPGEPPFLDARTVSLSRSHTQSGNPMRFTTGQIAIRRDDEWREGLGRAARLLVTAITWPLLKAYGYRLRA